MSDAEISQITILKGFDLTWWVGKSDIRLELHQLDAKWCGYVHRVWYSLLTCLLVCLFACLLVYSTAETEEYQTLAPICVATEMPFQMFIMFWPTNTPQKNATQMLQPDYFHRFWANDVTFSSDDFSKFFIPGISGEICDIRRCQRISSLGWSNSVVIFVINIIEFIII